MYLKLFAAAAIAIPFSLVGTGLTTSLATPTALIVKPNSTLSRLSPLPTLVAQTSWTEFLSSDGKFAISMPGTPKQETETDEDGLTSYSFTVELDNPNSMYAIIYYDVSKDNTGTPEQVKNLLTATSDEFIKEAEARLTRSQNIILDGNPGREFEFNLTEGLSGKGRVYLVQQRVFFVVAVAPQRQSLQRFLDSFRLL